MALEAWRRRHPLVDQPHDPARHSRHRRRLATRVFRIGISFPAGSGLVAFAGALGMMPLEMPESVLVRFSGELQPGITLRDVVNAIPWLAIQQGLLTVEKKNKKNVFNGRILEMEGLPDLKVEQAFELTDASAERSAAASTIALSSETVAEFLRSNVALLRSTRFAMATVIRQRSNGGSRRCEAWLANPSLAATRRATPSTPQSSRSTSMRSTSRSSPVPTTPTTSSGSPRSPAGRSTRSSSARA